MTGAQFGGDWQRARLANLRHELRTPLNAIIGYSELLLEDSAPAAPLANDLRRILRAGRQLLALVNSLLDPAKLDAADAPLDLAALESKLRHELTTPIAAIIGYTELLLEDSPEDNRAPLAEDLARIHAAAERFLGLISHIIEFFEQDAPAAGSPSRSALPLAAPPAQVTALLAQWERSQQRRAPGSGAILVADDDPVSRDMLARRLSQEGHRVTLACDGRECLERVAAQTFDLILLDMMMPDLSGYEALGRLKAEGAWRDIPVIMISAMDDLESLTRCIDLGAEDYLAKPAHPATLRARVNACLERKWLRDQEAEYLANVAQVTAAAAVDAGDYSLASLGGPLRRNDELGQLARVFQRMVNQIHSRELTLRRQVRELTIEIDQAKRARQVAAITETDYFKMLQRKSQELRSRAAASAP